jgi:hypothetical protein
MQKAPQERGFFQQQYSARLQRLDIGSLRAFLTHTFGVANFLAFLQALEAVNLDLGEVSEQVVAAIVRGDEAKAFSVVKPLNGTGFHILNPKESIEELSLRVHENQGIDIGTRRAV